MPRNRFAGTGEKRIEISDGDFIIVKEGLDAGDQRKQAALSVVAYKLPNGEVVDRVDWSRYELERTALWLLGWSLQKPDAQGVMQPMPATLDSLKALEPKDFEEINEAVYKHMLEWRAKKLPSKKEVTPLSADSSLVTSS